MSWTIDNINSITSLKKSFINDFKKKYDLLINDSKKSKRKAAKMCKYCYYINSNIGGNAITNSKCMNCGKQITNSTTNVDFICTECSNKFNICRHCGSKLDY